MLVLLMRFTKQTSRSKCLLSFNPNRNLNTKTRFFSHLVRAPVPDGVDGQAKDSRPGNVTVLGVSEQVHVVVTRFATRVVAVA